MDTILIKITEHFYNPFICNTDYSELAVSINTIRCLLSALARLTDLEEHLYLHL